MNETADNRITNALTVDVEDWVQSVYDVDRPLTDRFIKNTDKILELFDRRGVRGTFFVLGLAAEKAPALVRRIQAGDSPKRAQCRGPWLPGMSVPIGPSRAHMPSRR